MRLLDGRGVIRRINRQAAALFGYEESMLLGCSIDTLVPKAHRLAHATERSEMQYVPPAGIVGHAVAKLFGVDPRHPE